MIIGKKEKIQLAVTGVGVLIFVMLIMPKGKKASKGAAVNVVPITFVSTGQPTGPAQGLFMRLSKEADKMELKNDPFFGSTIVIEKEADGMYLMGIAWDPQKPTAIINNRIVTLGTQIEEKTVIYIGRDKVILNDGEQNYELHLGL